MSASIYKFKVPKYSNDFGNNHELTHEYGCQKWDKQNQKYEGTYLGSTIHGEGTYKWNNSTVYEGSFYSNIKEGYALVSLPNNSCFEGLFIKNQPFGPGVYTHANGRQDVGFWIGRKLVRLSRAVDFIIPRLAATSSAKMKLLQSRRPIPLNQNSSESVTEILESCNYPTNSKLTDKTAPFSKLMHDSRNIAFDKSTFDDTYFLNSKKLTSNSTKSIIAIDQTKELELESNEENKEVVTQSSVPEHYRCLKDIYVMKYPKTKEIDKCAEKHSIEDENLGVLTYYSKFGTMKGFLGSVNSSESLHSHENTKNDEEIVDEIEENALADQIVSWSKNELRTEMLKQIHRYRAFEGKLSIKIAKLMLGRRAAFRRTGEKERQCLQFLKMCSLGPLYVVKDLLCNYEISEELMDSRGNNSLMFAAAADQQDIIDLLLDYGVDVNTFNDEGLTPLNLCLLRRLAQANKITNWEEAFLPSEVNETLDGFQTGEWRQGESIESLDRLFGDGMSLEDSESIFNDEILETSAMSNTWKREILSLNEIKEHSDASKITIENFKSSLGSTYSCPCSTINKNSSSASLNVCDSTPKICTKIVPKSYRREEFESSVAQGTGGRYFFDLTVPKILAPEILEGKPSSKTKSASQRKTSTSVRSVLVNDFKELDAIEEDKEDSDLVSKIQEIDRTIEKLLKRGADPNLSDIPKPPIHLGVFTKDTNIASLLLGYGANPNHQLYSNEGLLTPLHVLALLKPAAEYVEICEMFLKSGANTEEETTPEFCIHKDEESFLDPLHGRTPLQLLCMRPDLEFGDPQGYLKKKALLLAKVSNKRHFFNGHSILTLAMMFGNFELLETLLQSKYFDPDDVLGKDLGTTLHVLVSTNFQRKTIFENSIKVCDMLLEAGANPFKKFKKPQKLIGTCVEYGYREIEIEKEARKTSGKKDAKPGKSDKRDHLPDHIRVVEYLGKMASQIKIVRESDLQCDQGGKTDQRGGRHRKSKLGKGDRDSLRDSDDSKGADGIKDSAEDDSSYKNKSGDKGEVSLLFEEKNPKDLRKQKDKHKGQKSDGDGKKKKTSGKGSKGLGKKGSEADRKKDGHTSDRKKDGHTSDGKKDEHNSDHKKDGHTAMTKDKSTSCSEAFQESLRKSLMQVFGKCSKFDVSEFLLPYVVLRDGNFYYRFQGKKPTQKEQYSLI